MNRVSNIQRKTLAAAILPDGLAAAAQRSIHSDVAQARGNLVRVTDVAGASSGKGRLAIPVPGGEVIMDFAQLLASGPGQGS